MRSIRRIPERLPATSARAGQTAHCTLAGGLGIWATATLGLLIAATTLPAQQLQLKRDLLIGEVEGAPELEFHRVSAIAVGPDGTLFIGNGGTGAIRAFSGEGKFLREFGRKGDGPGEFRSIYRLAVARDTLFAIDASAERTTAFSLVGRVLATWPMGPRFARQLHPLSPVPGGWMVQPSTLDSAMIMRGPREGEIIKLTFEVAHVRELRPASVARVIARYAMPERVVKRLGSGRIAELAPLFSPEPMAAADQRGLAYVSLSDPYRIDVYDTTGARIRTLTRPYQPLRVTRAHADAFEKLRVTAARPENEMQRRQLEFRAEVDAATLALPLREHLPPIGKLVVSPDGWLWAERIDLVESPAGRLVYPPLPQSSAWDVYDPSGRFIGNARLPDRFLLRAVTSDAAIGVQRDEDDVERVARYRVRRL